MKRTVRLSSIYHPMGDALSDAISSATSAATNAATTSATDSITALLDPSQLASNPYVWLAGALITISLLASFKVLLT